jgi:hypothetical protein
MDGTIDERDDVKEKEREREKRKKIDEQSLSCSPLFLLLSFWSGRLKNE